MPKWRNRQTQGTQNPPSLRVHEGSTPSFGIFFFFLFLILPELIDKIVAVVNDKPITLSEVNLIKKIEGKEIPFDDALGKTILINLKYQEALKYINPLVSKEEKEYLLKEFNLEKNKENIELISKLLIIKKYVESIIDPTIFITEEEIQNFIEKNNLKIENDSKEFEELKKLIFLKKENEILKNWEEKLKNEAMIKILN